MSDSCGADNQKMARWQGQMEEALKAEIQLRDTLRKSDAEAIKEARETAAAAVDKAETQVARRLEGFPQLYASRTGLEALQEAISNLRSNTVPDQVYRERHKALEDRLARTESLLMRAIGGLFIVGLIGVTNLIRIWAG